jgi:putative oxidoreductase
MSVDTSGTAPGSSGTVIAAGRILMGLSFIYYGVSKFFFIPGTIGFVATKLPMATEVFWLAVVIEIGGGALLVLGLATRWVAYFYAFYCCFTAVVFHFVPENRGVLDHFFENFALAGGFLILAVVGPGAAALDNKRA